jgi:hypothetical protein
MNNFIIKLHTASFSCRLYQTELGTEEWLSRPSLQVYYEPAEKCALIQSRPTPILWKWSSRSYKACSSFFFAEVNRAAGQLQFSSFSQKFHEADYSPN